jgi:hypothetical protein
MRIVAYSRLLREITTLRSVGPAFGAFLCMLISFDDEVYSLTARGFKVFNFQREALVDLAGTHSGKPVYLVCLIAEPLKLLG